jgi:hypothetical protein
MPISGGSETMASVVLHGTCSPILIIVRLRWLGIPPRRWMLGVSRALSGLTRDDLFFSPGYNSPLFCTARFVFTIYDLSHIYCPENSNPLIRLYCATVMKRGCRRALSILTVSEFTRSQVIEWSGVSAEKVFNVGCGVDPTYQPAKKATVCNSPTFCA